MTDERKDIFIETVERLFAEKLLENENSISPTALEFFEDYKKGKSSNKKIITDKGIKIIRTMQGLDNEWMTANAISEYMDLTSKSISGSMKKLVTDGFVDMLKGNPASYKLTEKGLNYETSLPEEDS